MDLFDTIYVYGTENSQLKKIYDNAVKKYKFNLGKMNSARKESESILDESILYEFQSNRFAASNKYYKRYINISGIISAIEKDLYGNYLVRLDELVKCVFSDNNISQILSLSVFNYVTLKGTITEYDKI